MTRSSRDPCKRYPELVELTRRAKRWGPTRKVPPTDQEDVLQNAVTEFLASGTFDDSRPLEPYFRTLVSRAVAQYFAARSRREEHLSSQAEAEAEAEISAVDAQMDRVDGWDFEAKIAEAASEAFEASSDGTKEAVALRAQGLEISEIASRLHTKEGAIRVRLSRFGEEFESKFGRKGFGNRVNITLVLQFIQPGVIEMNGTGSVFVTGTVGGNFAENGNNTVVDIHFDRVAAGVGQMRSVVEADHTVPAGTKAEVAEGLSDIQAEAGAAVPSVDAIQRMMHTVTQAYPAVRAIAKSIGVPWFA
jgi:DNA-directed RNA polymerase specialized sigma24 family protein